MFKNTMDLKSKVALKFIMGKIKRLVIDQRGNLSYMENLDEILKDIFGVKHFTKKLDSCYDDRESVAVIDEIGMKNLMTICNTPRIYDAFSELVVMNFEIYRINKIIKKLEKKGKNKERKSFEKEYEYLINVYKKAVKTLRKTFGTKNPSYKKKFKSVSNLIESKKGFNYYDDDAGSISSVLYDDEDSIYDDDDDFDSDENEFERYLKKIVKGENPKKEKRKEKISRQSLDDDDDDFDSDEDDEDEEDIDSRVDGISNKLDTVTSAIQLLINSNNSNRNYQPQQPPPVVQTNTNGNNNDIAELNKAILYLAKCQKDSVEKQNEMMEVMMSMMEEDTEDTEDTVEDTVSYNAIINETTTMKKSPANMSREELIDFVSRTAPNTHCSSDVIEPKVSD